MYRGEPTEGIEFYRLLCDSDEFTSELGKVTLASGKLESELIIFLKKCGVKRNIDRVTLGTLISIAERSNFFDKNMISALRETLIHRNYITHNIYALFIDNLEETILEKHNLLDSDVHTYIDRALQLKENLIELAEIIKLKNEV